MLTPGGAGLGSIPLQRPGNSGWRAAPPRDTTVPWERGQHSAWERGEHSDCERGQHSARERRHAGRLVRAAAQLASSVAPGLLVGFSIHETWKASHQNSRVCFPRVSSSKTQRFFWQADALFWPSGRLKQGRKTNLQGMWVCNVRSV